MNLKFEPINLGTACACVYRHAVQAVRTYVSLKFRSETDYTF